MRDEIDVLGINLECIKQEIQAYIQDDFDWEHIKKAIRDTLNDAVDIETDEITEVGGNKQNLMIRRNGQGKYVSINNIRISFDMLILGLQAIVQRDIFPCAFLLDKILGQIGVNINRLQMEIYIIIRDDAGRNITDDNIMEFVQGELNSHGYEDISRRDIASALRFLIDMVDLVDVIDGKYVAKDEIMINF